MKKFLKEKLAKIKENIKFDLVAGITVALVMIPQSMAYAGIANLPMEVGLYTAFIGVIFGAIFGSSKQMSTGPVTIISIMTAATIGSMGIKSGNEYVIYASILAMLIGIIYFILAILRLGIIVEFLSHPVIIGFTNAIALITIFSQLEKIFGINSIKGDHYIETLFILFTTILSGFHSISLVFGLGGIILLLIFKRFFPKLPGVLILIIISTIISYFINFESNFGGLVVGEIPSGLPNLINFENIIRFIDIETIFNLLPFAFIIAIIGFTESVSVAKVVSIKTKQKLESNKELIGQSLANIFSGLFGGYGVAGSFSRTAVNLRAEAKSSFSSIITGIIIGLTLMFLTRLLYFIPMPTLSAIIIVAVGGLIKIKPIIEAWKIQKNDSFIAILTFILTILLNPNVEKAIGIGVFLSLIFYIYKSMKPKVVELGMYKTLVLKDANFFRLKKSKDISIFRVDGNLFFANIGHFEKTVLNFVSEKKDLKVVVFDFEWMPNIDSSGFGALKDLINKLQKLGIKVILCGLRVKVIYKMSKVGFIKNFGKDNIFEKTENVINYLKEKYEKSEINLKPLLEYSPKNKKESKKSGEILKEIHN